MRIGLLVAAGLGAVTAIGGGISPASGVDKLAEVVYFSICAAMAVLGWMARSSGR